MALFSLDGGGRAEWAGRETDGSSRNFRDALSPTKAAPLTRMFILFTECQVQWSSTVARRHLLSHCDKVYRILGHYARSRLSDEFAHGGSTTERDVPELQATPDAQKRVSAVSPAGYGEPGRSSGISAELESRFRTRWVSSLVSRHRELPWIADFARLPLRIFCWSRFQLC
jgi:hypothetical protein